MGMSPRKRARISRGVQYAVLAVIVVVIVFAADWAIIKDKFANPEIALAMFPEVITTALKNTILYTACGFAFGLALGLVLALMRLSPVGPYRWMATTFIEFFRGVPALVVFLALSVGIPTAFPGYSVPGDVLGTATIALGLVGGAYMAETIRAGIQAVPKGQTEAARSLGMSAGRTTVTVVLPQAFRIVIPPLTNEFVLLIKDTALLFVIGFAADQRELTTIARDFMASSETAGTATSLIQASILYLLITLPLTRLVSWLEHKQQKAR